MNEKRALSKLGEDGNFVTSHSVIIPSPCSQPAFESWWGSFRHILSGPGHKTRSPVTAGADDDLIRALATGDRKGNESIIQELKRRSKTTIIHKWNDPLPRKTNRQTSDETSIVFPHSCTNDKSHKSHKASDRSTRMTHS